MKTNKILAMLLSMACAIGFYSCSDDDDIKPALQNPTVNKSAAAYNSLSFEWSEVPNAVQYGYQLYDPENVAIRSGVTHDKNVTLTGLKPATTYTLKVWAFASMDGDYSTPEAVTLTATTDPLIKLATPQNLELTTGNGYTYTATWSAVENATIYVCNVRSNDGTLASTDSISETTLEIRNLESGDYTLQVYAAAHDGYDNGDAATDTFTVDKPAEPIYTVTGTYYSDQLGTSWTAKMEAFADGTYSIKAFYGVEGYDLDFKVDESNADDMFEILTGHQVYEDGYYSWQVSTGLSDPSVIVTYPWYNYSYFEGNQTSGEVGIGTFYDNYDSWGYDVFTWGGSGESIVDELVGTYDCHFTGWDYYLSGSGETTWDDTWTDYATVTKVDDVTVEIDGLFYTEEPVRGVVDPGNLTITLEMKNDYYEYYTVASIENYDVPVVATIGSDGSITVADWALWYNYGSESQPKWYTYLEGTSVLTPSAKAASKYHKLSKPSAGKIKKATVKRSGSVAPKKANAARKPVHKPIR